MTNELEKQFFDTFGIESREKRFQVCKKDFKWKETNCEIPCINCEHSVFTDIYPQITDRILLELICILASCMENSYGDYYKIWETNYKDLKEAILDDCICYRELNNIKHQVQALFKE